MQQVPPQFRCVVLGNTAAALAAEELQVLGERAAASALLLMCVFLLFCPISYLVAAATTPAAAAAAALLQDGDLHLLCPVTDGRLLDVILSGDSQFHLCRPAVYIVGGQATTQTTVHHSPTQTN